ncbi:hypothetical protein A2U01_0095163, partial [Trifolium medium]|nr:hypothetical protein [Trifolium medium]
MFMRLVMMGQGKGCGTLYRRVFERRGWK